MTAQPWAIEFQNEWGVPDWHDESQYPAPGDLPAELWRWQFIRRMGDYREAWDRAAPMEAALYMEVTSEGRTLASELGMPVPPHYRGFHVGMVPVDHPEQFRELIRYQLLGWPNPRTNLPTGTLLYRDNLGGAGLAIAEADGVVTRNTYIKPHHARVSFDLAAPLEPQLTRVTRALRQLQSAQGEQFGFAAEVNTKGKQRVRDDRWPLYLRVLDARNDGATFDEIGRTIRPNDARGDDIKVLAKQWHNAAKRVANKGTR